jgi:hypothetical protein
VILAANISLIRQKAVAMRRLTLTIGGIVDGFSEL